MKQEKNSKALILLKEIKLLELERKKLNTKIHTMRQRLERVCIHNETEIKHSYVEGGYLDREKFIRTEVCKICDKQIDEEITIGGFC